MAPLLEVRNFEYSYGNIRVVKGIDLRVDEGEIVAIIGANGAGKTTTLRSISGLTDARGLKGEIVFRGRDIAGFRGNRVAAMGLVQVLEGRHIFPKLTVAENLAVGAYARGDGINPREAMRGIYKRFPRLEERRSQMGGTLSGGEQQMLAIGRALIANPRLILLDEPSLGLAPLIIKEIFAAIREIREDGATVLLVEQNSKIALATADNGYVLQNGEVVMRDSCRNLAANNDVKKAYLGED